MQKDTMPITDSASYKKKMGITKYPDLEDAERLKLALEYANRAREFEINLYWKRTAYFWVFIAGTFAAYSAILFSDNELIKYLKYSFCFGIACAGFFFTHAWIYANKGNKFWQENWEIHVKELGEPIIGPLFETFLSFDEKTKPYSVSKINEFIGDFMLGVWLILGSLVIGMEISSSKENPQFFSFLKWIVIIFLILITVARCNATKDNAKSNLEKHTCDHYVQHGLKNSKI